MPADSYGPPATARPPATLGRRFVANLIDNAVVLAAAVLLLALSAGAVNLGGLGVLLLLNLAFPLLLLVYAIYTWWRLATQGLSIGKQAMGLRLVSEDDQRPIGWGRVFVRQLVLGLISFFTAGIGLIVLAVVASNEPRRRGWHDLAAGSMVVDDREREPAPISPAQRQPRAAPAVVPVGLPPSVPRATVLTPQSGVPAPVGHVPTSALSPSPAPAPRPPQPTTPAPVAPTAPVWAPARKTAGGGLIAEVPGVRPAAATVDVVPAQPTFLPDDVEHTRMAARPKPSGGWLLDVGSGQVVTVTGAGLLGRDPEPRQDEQVEHLVKVIDSTRSVSKTHLSFGVDEEGFWVLDRHSTNGSILLGADESRQRCAAGERVRVAAGMTVLIGDHRLAVSRS